MDRIEFSMSRDAVGRWSFSFDSSLKQFVDGILCDSPVMQDWGIPAAAFLAVFLSFCALQILSSSKFVFLNCTLILLSVPGFFCSTHWVLVLLRSHLNFYSSLWLLGCSGFLRHTFPIRHVNLSCPGYQGQGFLTCPNSQINVSLK